MKNNFLSLCLMLLALTRAMAGEAELIAFERDNDQIQVELSFKNIPDPVKSSYFVALTIFNKKGSDLYYFDTASKGLLFYDITDGAPLIIDDFWLPDLKRPESDILQVIKTGETKTFWLDSRRLNPKKFFRLQKRALMGRLNFRLMEAGQLKDATIWTNPITFPSP